MLLVTLAAVDGSGDVIDVILLPLVASTVPGTASLVDVVVVSGACMDCPGRTFEMVALDVKRSELGLEDDCKAVDVVGDVLRPELSTVLVELSDVPSEALTLLVKGSAIVVLVYRP